MSQFVKSDVQHRLRSRRSKQGCLTCRKRKVKCNEDRPLCDRCRVGARTCVWPQIRASSAHDDLDGLLLSPTNDVEHAGALSLAGVQPPGEPESGMTELLDYQTRIDLTFLQPYFPDLDERLIARHYFAQTSHELLAHFSPTHPFNPWITVHAPLAFTKTPGSSLVHDALRISIVAVGAVHLRFKRDPSDQDGARKISSAARKRVFDILEKVTARGMDAQEEIEVFLAALLSCIIANTLAADGAWDKLMVAVLTLIESLGGAQRLLAAASTSRYSINRFMFEQFAVRDVIGCLSTGRAPVILQEAASQWFVDARQWSGSDQEWESVDRMFGVSRRMVLLVARTCALRIRVRGVELGTGLEPFALELERAGRMLLADLQQLEADLDFTSPHHRTTYGDRSFSHAMRLIILRDILHTPRTEERCQASAAAIIELCEDVIVTYRRLNWLTWPILIAGFQLDKEDDSRHAVLKLLGFHGANLAFDDAAAITLLQDFWTIADSEPAEASSTWDTLERTGKVFFVG